MGFAEGMCTVVGQINDVLHDDRPRSTGTTRTRHGSRQQVDHQISNA
jgi:hypothetical protein